MHAKLRTGSIFAGRFRVEKFHAEDALGAFWDAIDQQTNAAVTLRTLSPETGLSRREFNECLAGLEKAQQLEHPSAVVPFELFKDGEGAIAVSRRIHGHSLHALRMSRPSHVLDPGDVEHIAISVSDAFEAAHRERVMHGGLRPDIIFVADDGRVQIADFGIAGTVTKTVLEKGQKRLQAAISPFVSRTLLKGEGPYLTDDVYAFGATMYVSLTDAPPLVPQKARFWSKPRAPRAPALINERRQRLSGRRPRVSSTWEQVILSCLDRDGFARPQRFSTVVRMLAPESAPTKGPGAEKANETTAAVTEIETPTVVSPPAVEPATWEEPHETPVEEAHEAPVAATSSKPAAIAPVPPRPAKTGGSGSRGWSDPITAEFWRGDLSGPAASATSREPRQTVPRVEREDFEPPRGPRRSGVFLRIMIVIVAAALVGLAVYYASIERDRHSTRDELLAAIQELPAQPSPEQIAAVQRQLEQQREQLDPQKWTELSRLWEERQRLFATSATNDATSPATMPAPPAQTTRTPEAPQTPAAPAATGGLTVRTLPIGAMIKIGNAEPQSGPAIADDLPAGPIQIAVSAEGYITKETTIEIISDQTQNIDVSLERAIGKASITSTTPGLPFEISSPSNDLVLQTGVTPQDIELPTGDYTVAFTLPDSPPVTQTMTVTPGEQALVSIEYSPPPEPALPPEPASLAETESPPAGPTGAQEEAAPEPSPPDDQQAIAEAETETEPVPATPPSVAAEPFQPRTQDSDTQTETASPAIGAAPAPEPESETPPSESAPAAEPPEVVSEDVPEDSQSKEVAGEDDPSGIAAIPTPAPEVQTPPVAPLSPAPAPQAETKPDDGASSSRTGVPSVESTPAEPPPAAETRPERASADTSSQADQHAETAPAPPAPANDGTVAIVVEGPVAAVGRKPVDTNRLYALSDVDTQPVLLEREEPKAPRRFRREDGVGTVRLSVIIDRQGFISSARVIETTDRRLAEACIEAVRYWRFSPAGIRGESVAVRAVLPLVFK
ncbi:MAG: TonB family protein [Opitutaceae bacterium]